MVGIIPLKPFDTLKKLKLWEYLFIDVEYLISQISEVFESAPTLHKTIQI